MLSNIAYDFPIFLSVCCNGSPHTSNLTSFDYLPFIFVILGTVCQSTYL